MNEFFDARSVVPREGYTWINAYAPPLLVWRQEPQHLESLLQSIGKKKLLPCLVFKEWQKAPSGIKALPVEFFEEVRKDEKPAYLAFYRLASFLQDTPKLQQAILEFANRYGNLNPERFLVTEDGRFVQGTSLAFWQREIYRFYNCFCLYELRGQPGPLGQHIIWRSNGVFFRYFGRRGKLEIRFNEKGIATGVQSFIEDTKGEFVNYARGEYCPGLERIASMEEAKSLGFRYGCVEEPAWYYLERKIAERLEESSGVTVRSRKMAVAFSGTLSLVWFQFAQLITGERQIRLCSICKEPMDVTGRRSDYQAHLACRNRQKVREFRERQRAKATGAKEAQGPSANVRERQKFDAGKTKKGESSVVNSKN